MPPTTRTSEQSRKEFIKLFEKFSYTNSYGTCFNDFLDFALLTFKWDKKAEDFAELERKYPTAEEHKILGELLRLFGEATDNDGAGFHDALGDLFMELISHGKNGQFFTPEEIADLQAMLTMPGVKDGQSVMDCACGSGRLLLSAAKMNRNVKLYGSDIDQTCCKMAVLNMLVNTLEGEIAHMDTLRMDHWKSWHIGKFMDFSGRYLPYYYTTGPGQTRFIERIRNTQEKAEAPVDVKMGKRNQILLF